MGLFLLRPYRGHPQRRHYELLQPAGSFALQCSAYYLLTSLQITSFGYTEEQSLIYGVPAGAIEVISLLGSGFLGQYTNQQLLCSTGGLIASIIGMVLVVALPLSNNVGRLIGYYMTLASATPFVALLAMISSNVAGYTKKTTVAAIYLIGYCAGNIIGMISSYFASLKLHY